jgi:hypothetical protein
MVAKHTRPFTKVRELKAVSSSGLALRRWFLWKLCAMPHCNNPDDIDFDFIKKPIR